MLPLSITPDHLKQINRRLIQYTSFKWARHSLWQFINIDKASEEPERNANLPQHADNETENAIIQ